jgi:hypothetical protein
LKPILNNKTKENMKEIFEKILKPTKKIFTYGRICTKDGISTNSGVKKIITRGDLVRVEEGVLGQVTPSTPYTHVITECKGTIDSSELYITVKGLDKGDIFDIKIN